MNANVLDAMADRLERCSLSDVSRATGMNYNTLKNVKEKKNATWATLARLQSYFADLDA